MQASLRRISELVRCGDKYDILFHDDAFNEAIDECGDSQIMIIPIIGQYQTGKSTFLSVLLGMDSIKIGNGIEDETMGIEFYGPINYCDLLARFGLKENMRKEIKLIFVDTQGYGGWKSGNGDSGVNNTRLLSSIIPLSQILLLYTHSNDSNINIQTLQDFFELMKCCFENFNENDFQIINLIRMHGKINHIDYSNPTQDTYNQLSEELKAVQTGKYQNINISKFLPYPQYDNEVANPSENLLNESFKNGFTFLITDLIQSIDIMSSRLYLNAERIKAIYNLYSRATGANYSLELFANQSRKNVDMEMLRKEIDKEIEPVIQKHLQYMDDVIRNIKELERYPYVHLSSDSGFEVEEAEFVLSQKVCCFANANLSYSSEIMDLYNIKIKTEFVDVASSKIDQLKADIYNAQISSAVNEFKYVLDDISRKTNDEVCNFSRRNEHKFSWKSFENQSKKAIENVIEKCIQAGMTETQIEEIRSRAGHLEMQEKNQLWNTLRTRVHHNEYVHSQRLQRIGDALATGGGRIVDAFESLLIVLQFMMDHEDECKDVYNACSKLAKRF